MGDKDLVNEEFCNKKHETIVKKIAEIDKALNGDGNIEDGLRYQTKILWLDYVQRRKTTMGWMDWLYRSIVGIMLTWICGAAAWLIQRLGTM